MREAARSLALILRTSWRISPVACVLAFTETLGSVLMGLLPTAFGAVVGAVAAGRAGATVAPLAFVIAALIVSSAFALVGVHFRLTMMEKVGHVFDQEIARLSAQIPTLDHLESPELADKVRAIKDDEGALGNAFNAVANGVRAFLLPLVLMGAAVAADWRMGILVAVAFLPALLQRFPMRWEAVAEEAAAPGGRRLEHLVTQALTPTPSGELRVLGARRSLLDRIARAAREWRDPHTRFAGRSAALAASASLVYYAVAAAVLVWIAADAAAGRVSPGRLTVALASAAALGDVAETFAWVVPWLAKNLRTVGRFRWLVDHAAAVDATHDGTGLPPARLRDGIVLDDVSFAYPGSERDALSHVSLTLPAGAVVAVVGENGAGKSTLVKALTGMYDLTGGEVLVDGVPLTSLDLAAWRARCAGAFQDHVRLETTALTGITTGDMAALDDRDRAASALVDAAATDVLRALPDGLDTQLGTLWDGVELSGGQWQRIAIARGMMRRAPLLLVLDEPTSALDPATEHALFEGYARAARETGGRGGVTVLVTHRFSTVAAADLVVVLAEGRVAEVGTHAELMAAGGTYAELYALQAAGYR